MAVWYIYVYTLKSLGSGLFLLRRAYDVIIDLRRRIINAMTHSFRYSNINCSFNRSNGYYNLAVNLI